MKLRELIQAIGENVATTGVESAGIIVCGRMWPVLRPVLVPAVEKFVGWGLANPDEALETALKESEKQDQYGQAVAKALSSMLDNLSDEHFQLLRGQELTYAEVSIANLARRRQLYWQMLAAWDFMRLWMEVRRAPDDENTRRRLRSVCAQVGLSLACIEHIEYKLYRDSSPEQTIFDLIATLQASAHPFVAYMAFTGGYLVDSPSAVVDKWDEYGLGSMVRPYLEEISKAVSDESHQKGIESLISALVQEG